MDLTLVIPIASLPFYIEHCLANIEETCGCRLEDLDIVFLTAQRISLPLQRGFAKAKKRFPFRVLQAPFDSLHLQLIDWAMRHGNFRKWVFLQHCDTFWFPETRPTLPPLMSKIEANPHVIAVCPNLEWTPFEFDGLPFPVMHDFAGVYLREEIVKRNWKFEWGQIGTEVKLSPEAIHYLKKGRIQRTDGTLWRSGCRPFSKKIIPGKDSLDGSEALTLEIMAHCPDRILEYPFLNVLCHAWAFFRPIASLWINGSTLHFPVDNSLYHWKLELWGVHAWISSLYFDLEEVPNQILPWKVFCGMPHLDREHLCEEVPKSRICKILSRYVRVKNFLGTESFHNVEEIKLSEIDLRRERENFVPVPRRIGLVL